MCVEWSSRMEVGGEGWGVCVELGARQGTRAGNWLGREESGCSEKAARPPDPLPWTLRGSEHPQRGCAASSVLAFQRVRVSIIRPSEGGSEGLPWLRG